LTEKRERGGVGGRGDGSIDLEFYGVGSRVKISRRIVVRIIAGKVGKCSRKV
jgi:hypothetical protein